MFQGLWPEHFNNKSFDLRDEDGFLRTVYLSVTEIDLNSLIREKTQQPTDATHVMVHKMDNSTSLHTVYIKALCSLQPQGIMVAQVINSVAGGATLIQLNEPDNKFFKVKCAI